MANGFRPQCGRHELVDKFPGRIVRVAKKDTRCLALEWIEWVVLVDGLREEVGLSQDNQGNVGIVDLYHFAAKVVRLEDWAVFFEQSLMITKMVRVNLEVVPNVRGTSRPWNLSYTVAVNGDTYRVRRLADIIN